ncbi:MAG: recombinase family protein [Solirubrobacterales bacterium]
MRLDAYIRVSRGAGREGDSFISPGVQRERIAAWAKAGRHTIVAWHEDLDQPGSRLERPGLTRIMERVEAGDTKGVVVAKLDRFGRSVVHLAGLIDRLRAADAALFTVEEGIDTSGPTGRLIADILGAIAEWELGRIRDNWDTARLAAVERGVHVSGQTPSGYSRRDDRTLEVDSEFAPLVTELFRRRIGGDSWGVLAEWFSAQGVLTPWGNENWSVNTIRSVIANRVYLGEARAGKDVVKKAAHPPLVSVAEFEAANKLRGVAPARSGRASGLLSGVLRCAGCRYAMKLNQGTTRHGKPFTEYRCKASRREVAGRCPSPASVKSSVIEPFVLSAFWKWIGDYRAGEFNSGDALQSAETQVRAAENELDAALDQDLVAALGGAKSDAFVRMVEKRRLALEEARDQLADLRVEAEATAIPDVDLSQLWPDLSLYEQRKLLSSAFDAVFVRRAGGAKSGGSVPIAARAFVCGHGSGLELPVRGQRWSVKAFEFPRDGAEALG